MKSYILECTSRSSLLVALLLSVLVLFACSDGDLLCLIRSYCWPAVVAVNIGRLF